MTSTPNPNEPGEPNEPGGAPPPSAAGGSSEGGLDPQVAGLLAYLLFAWIGGLIMFLTQKHPEVRFHGAQSILVSIAFAVVGIGLGILSMIFGFIPGLGFIAAILGFLLSVVLSIGGFVLFIFLCIKGYNLEHFKLPYIGDMAESWAGYKPAQA